MAFLKFHDALGTGADMSEFVNGVSDIDLTDSVDFTIIDEGFLANGNFFSLIGYDTFPPFYVTVVIRPVPGGAFLEDITYFDQFLRPTITRRSSTTYLDIWNPALNAPITC